VITVVQRVHYARVLVDDECVGSIEKGLLLFVGVEEGDGERDADETARKVRNLRIFPDRKPTDLSVEDIGGSCLVVSQFTLAAELRHGNRPDFTAAAPPELANALYERVAANLRSAGINVATGQFAADMNVELSNDGPITLLVKVRDGKVVPRANQP
jgi:D-tyrosyl-tRNA(Tyr) deacylase